ncbi:MAG: hypothetical protein ACEY3J_01120 [Arsenophonus sp.]
MTQLEIQNFEVAFNFRPIETEVEIWLDVRAAAYITFNAIGIQWRIAMNSRTCLYYRI